MDTIIRRKIVRLCLTMHFRPCIRYFPRCSPIWNIKMQVRAKVSNPNRIGRVLFTNFSDPRTYSGSIQYLALLFYGCSPVGVHDEGVSQRRTRLAVVHNVRVTLAKPRKILSTSFASVTGYSLLTNNMFSGSSMSACPLSPIICSSSARYRAVHAFVSLRIIFLPIVRP
jgi:hypothetical protein